MSLRATVLVPAHNEASVITRTLTPLRAAAEAGVLRVVVIANGCNGVGLTGDDQGRRSYAAETGGIPGGQRNGCLDTAFRSHTQGTTTTHGPTNHTQTAGINHAAYRATAGAVLADQIIQCAVDLTRTAWRLIKAGVGIDGHDHKAVGGKLWTPPFNRGLGRDIAGNHDHRRHGAGLAGGPACFEDPAAPQLR